MILEIKAFFNIGQRRAETFTDGGHLGMHRNTECLPHISYLSQHPGYSGHITGLQEEGLKGLHGPSHTLMQKFWKHESSMCPEKQSVCEPASPKRQSGFYLKERGRWRRKRRRRWKKKRKKKKSSCFSSITSSVSLSLQMRMFWGPE